MHRRAAKNLCWILDAGSWMLDPGCGVLDACCRILRIPIIQFSSLIELPATGIPLFPRRRLHPIDKFHCDE
ncbi:MAG: hypothetical protein C4530_01770 [Desulfobacteraceae bacterium]|nr:MAG: hypothetical protein C4530_01770 [Desulfobacteraceae bacterium]